MVLQSHPLSVFAAWAAFNGKAYHASKEDLQARLPVFTANVARQISRLGLSSESMEVNGLADISTEEFKATHLGHVSKSIVTELGCAQGRKQSPPPSSPKPFSCCQAERCAYGSWATALGLCAIHMQVLTVMSTPFHVAQNSSGAMCIDPNATQDSQGFSCQGWQAQQGAPPAITPS